MVLLIFWHLKTLNFKDYVEISETEFQKNDLFCNPKEKKPDVCRVLSLLSEAGVNS